MAELNRIRDSLTNTAESEREKKILDRQLEFDEKTVNDIIAQNARMAPARTGYNKQHDAPASRY